MGVPIQSFDDFERKFRQRRHSSNLFAFFLFDDRPSQKAIEKFSTENFKWLDTLAAAAKMFFFVFLRPDSSTPGGISNPSLEVGRLFDLTPNKLPGIVLFTLADDRKGVSKGVFFPLQPELFDAEIARVEAVFSDLFSILQKCNKRGQEKEILLEEIEKEIDRLRSRERRRPVIQYLQGKLIALANYPTELLESIGEAFAKETARRLAGGG